MDYNDNILNTFKQKYAKDLIICCLGEEASLYAEDFKFTDRHLIKYQNNIVNNLDLIKEKSILDIGSNTGLWAVLMYLNGAKKVTCIEPRKQLAFGINQFAQLHKLPILAINDFHSGIFNLNTFFDTTFMMGVDNKISDLITFLNNLKKVSNFLVLRTFNSDDTVPENSIKITFDHNFNYRGGFNINAKIDELDGMCYQSDANDYVNKPQQGRYLKQQFGKNFYETLFDYLEYKIINFSTYSEDPTQPNKVYTVKLK